MADVDWSASDDDYDRHQINLDENWLERIAYWPRIIAVVFFGGWPLGVLVNELLK